VAFVLAAAQIVSDATDAPDRIGHLLAALINFDAMQQESQRVARENRGPDEHQRSTASQRFNLNVDSAT
jgi:hypothetical protein